MSPVQRGQDGGIGNSPNAEGKVTQYGVVLKLGAVLSMLGVKLSIKNKNSMAVEAVNSTIILGLT